MRRVASEVVEEVGTMLPQEGQEEGCEDMDGAEGVMSSVEDAMIYGQSCRAKAWTGRVGRGPLGMARR